VSRKKIAIVLSRFPYPLNKGDKLRAFHQIIFLAKQNDIFLYCLITNDLLFSPVFGILYLPQKGKINV